MKRIQPRRKTLTLVGGVSSLLLVSAVHAGGLYAWEIGTPTLGTAGAGWAAMPEDASTAFTNPAGTVWRDSTEMMVAAQMLYGDVEFSDGGESNVPGGDGGNAIEWFPGGGAHVAGKITDTIGWGFSATGNFGGVLDYDDDWKGQRFVNNVDLISMGLLPSLSWKANPCLSFGVALNVLAGYYDYESSPRAGLLGGNASLDYHDKDVGYGGNLGVIYKPAATTTLGLTFTSEVDLEFKEKLRLRNFGPLFERLVEGLNNSETRIDMNVPATVTASLQQAMNHSTTLYANLAWQDWSRFGKVGLEIDNPDQTRATVNRQYKDTWNAALGVRHHFDSGALNDWSLSIGVAYDSSMVDDEDRTADVVVDSAWRLGLGAQKELCPGLTLDIGYTLVWMDDVEIDQFGGSPFNPRLQGSYKDSSLNFFGAAVQFEI